MAAPALSLHGVPACAFCAYDWERCSQTFRNHWPALSLCRTVQLSMEAGLRASSGNSSSTLVVRRKVASCMRKGTPSRLWEGGAAESLPTQDCHLPTIIAPPPLFPTDLTPTHRRSRQAPPLLASRSLRLEGSGLVVGDSPKLSVRARWAWGLRGREGWDY